MSPARPTRSLRTPLAWLGLALGLALSGLATEKTGDAYNIGFFPYMFGGAPEADARTAFRYWVQIIGHESGVNVSSISRVFTNAHDAAAAAKAGTTDIIAFSSVDYLVIRDELPPGRILSPIRSTGQTEEYVLVTHVDSPGTKLADFTGKTLTRLTLANALLGPLWLEGELHAAGLATATEHFAEIRAMTKPAKVLLPVFFKQADLCLITRAAYDTLCELNPQVQKQTRIIARSPLLVTTLVWTAQPPGSVLHERAFEAIRQLQNTTSGRQTLLLFQFLQMQDCPDEMLDTTRALIRRLPPQFADASELLRLKE